MPKYWLFKKEPKNISIDDLEREGVIGWHGVRNYQARNYIRDSMAIGDLVLVYHSNSEPSGIVGLGEICSKPYPDLTAQDPSTYHYDPKATLQKPIWEMIDLRFIERFPRLISLQEIKESPSLQDMLVIRRGMRLSIQPVNKADFEEIIRLSHTSF